MFNDDVYTHNFKIDCGTNQVQQLFEVRCLRWQYIGYAHAHNLKLTVHPKYSFS